MKKYKLQIITMAFFVFLVMFLSACARVVDTCADELTMNNWYTETKSGISADLRFYEGFGELRVFLPQEAEPMCIKGVLAVDGENFYLTSEEFGRTYTFSYEVFGDRLEITYNLETLIFYPEKEVPEETTEAFSEQRQG